MGGRYARISPDIFILVYPHAVVDALTVGGRREKISPLIFIRVYLRALGGSHIVGTLFARASIIYNTLLRSATHFYCAP